MNLIYLGLGSNLGNLIENIENAYQLIEEKIGIIGIKSTYYYSEPHGFVSENNFINSVICVESNLSPFQLLSQIEGIEKKMGRESKSKNKNHSDRIMDIDILFFNDLVINSEKLIIPHPELAKREFVLKPLNDIASDFIEPISKKSISTLYEQYKSKESN